MLYHVKIFASLMALTALSALNCYGQGCDEPCDQSSYPPSQFVDVEINGCVYTVQYRARATCTQGGAPIYDLYIEAILTSDPNCLGQYPNGIVDEAAVALMQRNPMGFPPATPGAPGARWRIARLACWSIIEDIYTGCIPSPCCITTVDAEYHSGCAELSFTPVEQVYASDCSAAPGCVGECLGDIFATP